jgi:hypothetical protein
VFLDAVSTVYLIFVIGNRVLLAQCSERYKYRSAYMMFAFPFLDLCPDAPLNVATHALLSLVSALYNLPHQ